MAASIEESNTALANSFSDHHAQVDHEAKTVSQNLQGPYAIKKSGQFWVFDLPGFINLKNPNTINYAYLAEKTGLSDLQCGKLVNFMTQSPSPTDKEMADYLQSIKVKGIGDVLGRGGHRLSIESDVAYKQRMHRQISALINSVEGGANVLNFQEEPRYGVKESATRMPIFKEIMADLGYVRVAHLDKRDVGIWVKKGLERKFKSIDKKLPLFVEVTSDDEEEFCFRGCIVQDSTYLYLNLHAYNRMTPHKTMDDFVTKLIALKEMAQAYADQHQPKLSLIIQGDMNLFKLDSMQQQRLRDAGFVVEPVKGQERFVKTGTPTCEAYLRASPKPAAVLSPVAAAPAFHSYPQSSSAPLPYVPQYPQPAFAPQQQPAPNSIALEENKQWLQTIFIGGFSIQADSNQENHYYIVHKDKTILENLSQTLSIHCGIEGRNGNPKFVQTAPQGGYFITLVDENLPQLLGSGLSFDATAFASKKQSSIAGSSTPSSHLPSSSSSAPPPLASPQHSASASSFAPASSNSLPYRVVLSHDRTMIKIAPFKYEDAAYFGPFANTTLVGRDKKEYRVQQNIMVNRQNYFFNWFSSEHAYHAQKIIFLKNNHPNLSKQQQDILLSMLMVIVSTEHKYTGKDYKMLVEENIHDLGLQSKQEFDALCHADFNFPHKVDGKQESFNFMRTVIALKAQQHPELAERAMACAREGIFPVEVSQYDYTWAAGPDGTGMNMLGIIWLEIGNRLLEKNDEAAAIAIPDPEGYYNTYLRGLADLSHNALAAHTKHPENWPKPHQGTMAAPQSGMLIDVQPFTTYEEQRAQRGEGFTFFGGFNKDEKIKAVGIFIAAIQHYNDNSGSMNGFDQQLSSRQLGALCEGGLGTDVAKIDPQALTVILNAIVPAGLGSFSTEELKKQLGIDLQKIDEKMRQAILAAIETSRRRPIVVSFN